MSIRTIGKTLFADLARSHRTPADLRAQRRVGEERFAEWNDIERGDIVGVRGYMFRSKMGELTLHVTSFELLSKSLMPLPDKWHGLHGRREALSSALRRLDRQSRRARHDDHAQPHHRRDATLHRRPRLLRSRDADAAARRRRCIGAAVRHPRQRALGRGDAAADRDRAQPQALDRRRHGARLRDRPHLSQRRHRHDAQSRVHDARALRRVLGRPRHAGVQRGVDRASRRRRHRRPRRSAARRTTISFKRPFARIGYLEGIAMYSRREVHARAVARSERRGARFSPSSACRPRRRTAMRSTRSSNACSSRISSSRRS